MGKKKALYLSSKDIAGMLQTISDKPSPTPQELAVIQGRIQKVTPTAPVKNTTKPLVRIPQEKPQANLGGKVQLPPVEIIEDKEDKNSEKESRKNKDEEQNDSEKAQEKLTVTGNKEIDNKLLNLMSTLVRVNNEKKPQEKETKTQDNENEVKEKEDKSGKDDKSTQDNKDNNPPQGIPQNLQLAIPNLLQILEKINSKSDTKIDSKVNDTSKLKSKAANETPVAGENKVKIDKDRTKTLLAAMKLVQSIGPLPQGALNNSNIMDQLRVAAEEASVAMKLLNKTGIPAKPKDKTATISDGNLSFNVQLLRDELKNSLNKSPNPAEPVPDTEVNKNTADSSTSNQPQLNNFITTLQDAINAQQSQPNAATSISGRAGVAVKQTEGKPTLSEVIPFDINVDSGDEAVQFKGSKKDKQSNDKQQSVFESDEQKIMKILNGLDQHDSGKPLNDDNGEKEVVTEIRSAYNELGEVINGVEQDEGMKKTKNAKEEDQEEEDEEGKGKKKKKDRAKAKKKKNDDDEEDSDGEDDGFINDDEDNDDKIFNDERKKKKKSSSRKDHLNKVLSYIKKAEDHLKMIGGKRVKNKAMQQPQDVEADTRVQKGKTDWKMLATKLARQLGLVLKKMAEKDQKLLAEKNRLQGVLATLAQSQKDDTVESDDGEEEADDSNDEDRSKIIHSMATKLLNFSRTVHDAQRDNHLRTPKKKKRILHNLVTRYRSLVAKILTNWMKLKSKGKKKSRIPKEGKGPKSAKRGEIIRSKGNSTANATVASVTPPKTLQKQLVKTEKKKKKNVPAKVVTKTSTTNSTNATNVKSVSDGEQDVIEVANK